MEYLENQTQWQLPQPSHVESHSPPHERTLSTDEWTRGPLNNMSSQINHPSQHQPSLDLHDPSTFNYGEMSAGVQPQPYWHTTTPYYYQPYTNYSLNNLPVSSYSTLNGATSSPPRAQQSPPPGQMEIDPALTAGTSVSHVQAYNGLTPGTISSYPYASRPLHSQQQQQQPILAVDPSLLLNSTPALPSPGVAPRNSKPTPPKAPLRDVLMPYLTSDKLVGSTAVGVIVKLLESYNYPEIDCDIRTDMFSKLSVQADDRFFKAWVEHPVAMEITRNWLRAGAADAEGGQWKATVNPILSALGRMRFTVDTLHSAKLGKIVVKLTKDSNSATRDLSLELEKKWRILVAGKSASSKDEESDESKQKKRRLSDAAVAKAAPAAKRPAVAPPSATKPVVKKEPVLVKKEPKVVVTAVKDAKSDSSFFSAKPKAKLPSFNKKSTPPPSKSEGTPGSLKDSSNVAQPSSFDPFQDALRSMKRNASPKTEARSTPPHVSQPAGPSKLGLGVKRKKSVTFAPDGELEQVKFIEKAIYDDDLQDTMHGMHNLRDLDRDEGAALHAHLFEEQIDWVDPLPLELTTPYEKGEKSVEKDLQAERERSALGAVYMSMSQIPESPLEPNRTTTESECETKLMKLGGDMDELSTEPPKIADLLSALPQSANNIPFGTQQGVTPQTAPVVDNAALMALLGNIQNSGVPNILQQFGLSGQISNPNSDPNWQGYHPNYQEPNSGFGSSEQAQSQWDSTDGGWSDRGGRGRGRGRGGRVRRGRKPCTFFAEGRCKFGDKCDFSHDI